MPGCGRAAVHSLWTRGNRPSRGGEVGGLVGRSGLAGLARADLLEATGRRRPKWLNATLAGDLTDRLGGLPTGLDELGRLNASLRPYADPVAQLGASLVQRLLGARHRRSCLPDGSQDRLSVRVVGGHEHMVPQRTGIVRVAYRPGIGRAPLGSASVGATGVADSGHEAQFTGKVNCAKMGSATGTVHLDYFDTLVATRKDGTSHD